MNERPICDVDPDDDKTIRQNIKENFKSLHKMLYSGTEPTKCIDFRRVLDECTSSAFEPFSDERLPPNKINDIIIGFEVEMNNLKTMIESKGRTEEQINAKLNDLEAMQTRLDSHLHKIINKEDFKVYQVKLTTNLINLKNTSKSLLKSSTQKLKKTLERDIGSVKKTLGDIKNVFTKQTRGTMRDASEFLLFLFMIFDVNPIKVEVLFERLREGNDIEYEYRSEQIHEEHIWKVDYDLLVEGKETKDLLEITNIDYFEEPYVDNTTGVKYVRNRKTHKIISADMIAMVLQRIHKSRREEEYLNKSKIIPSEFIQISKGKLLWLVASVIFEHAHYTIIFRCENQWYAYNDMGVTKGKFVIKYADDYQTMLKRDDKKVQRNGVIHFYLSEDLIPDANVIEL